MIYGYPPFYVDPEKYGKLERKAIYKKIVKGFLAEIKNTEKYGYGPWFPDHIETSSEVRDLISNLLTKNITERYTAIQALTHEWILNVDEVLISGYIRLNAMSITIPLEIKDLILKRYNLIDFMISIDQKCI